MNAYEIRAHQVVEYIKLHETSLLQDADKLANLLENFEGDLDSDEYRGLEIEDMNNTGELYATRHILSVVADILGIQTEEK
jgi:hypothetical protein